MHIIRLKPPYCPGRFLSGLQCRLPPGPSIHCSSCFTSLNASGIHQSSCYQVCVITDSASDHCAGQGDLRAAVDAVLDDSLRRGGQTRFRGVTADAQAFLEEQYPGRFRFTPYRDSFDYIYTVEELTELRGKKLQSKRNHCHRFESEHPDWHTEVITAENIEKCREMVALWYQNHPENYEIQSEKKAIAKAFDHFAAIGMDGWMLLDGEQVLGFSMGYRMNRTYYDVCFEKAFADVQGAYTMINREFSCHIAEKYPELEFLNREDDMGEPGLRKAKESYQPTLLLEKCTADLQGGF